MNISEKFYLVGMCECCLSYKCMHDTIPMNELSLADKMSFYLCINWFKKNDTWKITTKQHVYLYFTLLGEELENKVIDMIKLHGAFNVRGGSFLEMSKENLQRLIDMNLSKRRNCILCKSTSHSSVKCTEYNSDDDSDYVPSEHEDGSDDDSEEYVDEEEEETLGEDVDMI